MILRFSTACMASVCLGLSLCSASFGAPVTFFGTTNGSGTGQVSGQTLTWTASPNAAHQVNPPGTDGRDRLDWGESGNPDSNGFNFDLTMSFPAVWTFESIEFSSLNIGAGDNQFAAQLLDGHGDAIAASALAPNSTSGHGASPWSYNAGTDRWAYSTLASSTNAHIATLTGSIAGVKKVLVDVDDHIGIDGVALDVTVPEPTSIALLGAAGAALGMRRRGKGARGDRHQHER